MHPTIGYELAQAKTTELRHQARRHVQAPARRRVRPGDHGRNLVPGPQQRIERGDRRRGGPREDESHGA